MKKIIFKGCGTAISTPFTKDGVNFEEFGKLIEFQISEGVDSYWRIFYYDRKREKRHY